jgi:hypothetical protein
LSLRLREEDATATGVTSGSDTVLSVFLFFPFLLFFVGGPRGASLAVAIPIVNSLLALILGAVTSSSSLRPGIGLWVVRVGRDQREGAARSGRREGCVPCRSPKEMDISCSRMDWSSNRMCLSTFESRRLQTQARAERGTYRVVGGLRKADLLLRSPHNFFHQPTNMSQVPSCGFCLCQHRVKIRRWWVAK